MPFRKILVRATNWVGDAVMSVPALQALRDAYQDAEISILARPWVAGLYGREPFCDELIPYDAPPGWRGLGTKAKLASRLRGREFDCAILFQNAFESAALVWLAGISVRIGYDRDARGLLLTHALPVPKPGETLRHQRFYYLELLRCARLIPDSPAVGSIQLHGGGAAARAGSKLFRSAGLTGPVVGISPGAAYGGAKRWLPERFAESGAQVARARGSAVAVFGSSEEKPICDIVTDSLQSRGLKVVNFAGQTSLSEFIEMAAACDLLLTNDSGPMHIASALGVPTVTVFGATDDEATGPTGLHTRVVRHPVECSPCLLRECPIDHRCMTRVSSDRVAREAFELLAVEPSPRP